MTEHEEVRTLLPLAAAGVLGVEEQLRVDRHVSECDLCRAELDTWSTYAVTLHAMRPVIAPDDLVERTCNRIAAERTHVARTRSEVLLFAAVAVFGWVAGLTAWLLFRLFAGGAIALVRLSFTELLVWSVASTIFVWLTAAIPAFALGHRRTMLRRAYESLR